MSEKSVRVQRVERELRHLVALYLQNDVPENLPALATVTAVDLTGDLRKAKVYIRLVGASKQAEESQEVLEGHRKRIQSRVAGELQLKFCPVLEFRFGQATKEEGEVDQLLAQLGKKKTPWE